MFGQPDPTRTASAGATAYTASPPGSPPMPYVGISAFGGQSPNPALSSAGYQGVPEIHDANNARPAPPHRFSVLSENSAVSPAGAQGIGGSYYSAPQTNLAAAANMGGFNPALASPVGSPTAQSFPYQPSTNPNTPLTANSEQGLFAHAQAQGYGKR